MARPKNGSRVAGDCVTGGFTTLWSLLWSITEQTHGKMESIRFILSKTEKKYRQTCFVLKLHYLTVRGFEPV